MGSVRPVPAEELAEVPGPLEVTKRMGWGGRVGRHRDGVCWGPASGRVHHMM